MKRAGGIDRFNWKPFFNCPFLIEHLILNRNIKCNLKKAGGGGGGGGVKKMFYKLAAPRCY